MRSRSPASVHTLNITSYVQTYIIEITNVVTFPTLFYLKPHRIPCRPHTCEVSCLKKQNMTWCQSQIQFIWESMSSIFNVNETCSVTLWRSKFYKAGLWSRSRKDSEVLGRVGFLTTLGVGVGFFVRLQLKKSNWIISYITLLSWELLLE